MAKPQRNFLLIIVPVAILVAWLAFGDGVFTGSADAENAPAAGPAAEHFQQAAKSIVEGAKERIAEAKSDEEAIQRAQMTFEALQIVGTLGGVDTGAEAGQLLSAIQKSGRTAVVEAVVQMRLANTFKRWQQLDASDRAAALNSFVSDVKTTGLTNSSAKLLMRIATYFGDGEDSKLITKAIKEIIPLAQKSDDAEVKRMAVVFDGIVRRIELPGKQLELEGTLLDGNKLDWNSYRGKVVLVDFHASWCGPCRAEVPNILENYEAYHDKGFDVIGINMDDERSGAEKYVKETGFKFPIVVGDDPSATGWNLPLARKYGVTGIPLVILVGKDGNVVSTEARGPRLGQILQQLLGEPDQASTRDTSRTKDSSVAPAAAEEEVAPAEPAPTEPAPEDSAVPEPPK